MALKHYEEAIKHDPTNMTYISNKAGMPLHTVANKLLQHTSVEATSERVVLMEQRNVQSKFILKFVLNGS